MPMYLSVITKVLGVFGKKPKLSMGDVAIDMLDRKDAVGGRGGVQKSASGHETMSKAKSSEQHLYFLQSEC
jgi:hypothetical protein